MRKLGLRGGRRGRAAGDASSFADSGLTSRRGRDDRRELRRGLDRRPTSIPQGAPAHVPFRARRCTRVGSHEKPGRGAHQLSSGPAQNKELIRAHWAGAAKVTVLAHGTPCRASRGAPQAHGRAGRPMANIAGYPRPSVEARLQVFRAGFFFSGQVHGGGAREGTRAGSSCWARASAGARTAKKKLAAAQGASAAPGGGPSTRARPSREAGREPRRQFVEFQASTSRARGRAAYAKEMSEAYLAAEQALIAPARQAVGHHSSRRRAHPRGQAGAAARDVRARVVQPWRTAPSSSNMAAEQGRQLPAHRARQDRREVRRHDQSGSTDLPSRHGRTRAKRPLLRRVVYKPAQGTSCVPDGASA